MIQSIQLSVPSMKCGGCATAIADALRTGPLVKVLRGLLKIKKLASAQMPPG